MRSVKLSQNQIQSQLEGLKSWSLESDRITRHFEFSDFKQAFSFMTEIAKIAEEMNHHPEWKNVYNKLDVELQTHDAGGLTNLDFSLAKKMEDLFTLQQQDLGAAQKPPKEK